MRFVSLLDRLEHEKQPQVLVYPSPLVIGRPNNLKLTRKQCMFSICVKLSELPLNISLSGNEKAVFRTYLSLSSSTPDNTNYDKRFEGGLISIDMEMAKHLLEVLLKDPLRKQDALDSIAGNLLSSMYLHKKQRGGTAPKLPLSARTTSTAFQTSLHLAINEAVCWDNCMLSLVFRTYSNVGVITVTPSLAAVRKMVQKTGDVFAKRSAENIQKALEANSNERYRIIKLMKGNRLYTDSSIRPSTNRVRENAELARDYLTHRLRHMQQLAHVDDDIKRHKDRQIYLQEKIKSQRREKIELEERRRQHKQMEQAEEYRKRKRQPLIVRWIILSRFFRWAKAVHQQMKSIKLLMQFEDNRLQMSRRIQRCWRAFVASKQARTMDDRHKVRAKMNILLWLNTFQETINDRGKRQIGLYFRTISEKTRARNVFLQSALYLRNVQKRMRMFAQDQKENVERLRKEYENARVSLLRIESNDKTIAEVQGLAMSLSTLDERLVDRVLKQLFKILWLRHIRINSTRLFGGEKVSSKKPLEQTTLEMRKQSSGQVYIKKVVPPGQQRVIDILTKSILRAPENAILNKVRPYESWISKAEESDKLLLTSFVQRRGASRNAVANKQDSALVTLQRAVTLGEQDEGLRNRVLEMVNRSAPLARFLESRTEFGTFEATTTSNLMKSLVLEIGRFNKKREDTDTFVALTSAMAATSVDESLINRLTTPN